MIAFTLLLFGCAKVDTPNQGLPSEQENPPDQGQGGNNSSQPPDNNDIEIEKNNAIHAILNQMTLDEKIGQLVFAGITGTSLTKENIALIHDHKVGGIIFFAANIQNTDQALELVNGIKSENEGNILPLFLGIDQEGGRVNRLPKEVTKLPASGEIGKKNDTQLANDVGSILGQQVNAFGFNVNFAPVLDVNSNPNNPVIGDRSFSNDPAVVGDLGIETMKGMQDQKVVPVIKHFPGHGDTAVDSHLELPSVTKSLEELNTLELVPFRAAVESGADMVMIAHILLPQLDDENPSTFSKAIITDLLRKDIGFNGVVITDDMTMQAITNHFDIGAAAVKSINSGSDIIMVAHDYQTIVASITALKDAVKKGELTEERIDESLFRIIALKLKYELNNSTIESIDTDRLNNATEAVLKKIK